MIRALHRHNEGRPITIYSALIYYYTFPGDNFCLDSTSQTRTVCSRDNTGDATLGITSVLRHALNLGEPVRVADDGRAHGVLDVEVLEVLLDIGRRLAKHGTFLGTLRRAAEPNVLGEPRGVVANGGTLVQGEKDLGDAGLPRGGVSAGVAESDDRAFGLREELVLGSLGTVAAGDPAHNLATLLEKRVRVLGQGRLLGIRDREDVAAQDELTPETDAQREDVALGDDDAVQVGLSRVVSGILGHGFTGV